MTEKPLVYDLGMNQGRNLPYYLAKGCRVVAVEAAPNLVSAARERFRDAIVAGDLIVLNVGVAAADGVGEFYLNSEDTVHSSFVKPAAWGPEWSVVEIPTRPVSKLIEEYGAPWFLKIDVEGYDGVVLRELMTAGVRPPSMSAEAHSIDVICALIALGYDEFQLINGRDIGTSISRREITTVDGRKVPYLFPRHAAGPFGDDLPGPWLSAEAAMYQWLGRRAFFGRGWIDVHARESIA